MREVFFLVLTIAVELPIALVLLRRADWRRVVLVVIGVNMVSHPIVWELIYRWGVNWWLAEIGVAAFEGLVLAMIFNKERSRAFFTGIIMNTITAAIGYIFF